MSPRKFSFDSIAAASVVLLAMTVSAAGGYWLKSNESSAVTQVAPARDVSGPAVDVPDAVDRALAHAPKAGTP